MIESWSQVPREAEGPLWSRLREPLLETEDYLSLGAKRRLLVHGGVPRKCIFHSRKIGRVGLQKVVAFIEEGKMKPVFDSVYETEKV